MIYKFFQKYLYDRKGDFKITILKSPLFLNVLILKLLFSFFFASHYLSTFFIPFVNYFIKSGFKNPYDFFFFNGFLNIFPYPAVMLWILSIPRILVGPFLNLDYNIVSNFHIFFYRLPILFADIAIFLILARWLKKKQKKVILYYWASPILFYINYVHGQLDVIPIMLLFVSLYFLFKERFFFSFALVGLAISAKTAILLALPFMVVYAYFKKIGFARTAILAMIPVILFFIVNWNYLFSQGFFEIVLNNKEQIKALDFNYRIGDNFILYFVPLAYLILFVRSLMYKSFNRDVFLMFLGFSFGILTLFIPPMQGWYYWVIPFLIYFFIKEENAPRSVFVLLNAFYFIYFLTISNSDFPDVFRFVLPSVSSWPNLYHALSSLGFPADIVVNLSFTLLQGSLLLCLFWVYRMGVESATRHKIHYAPYLIGLAGDSGTGKSTYASLIRDVFGAKEVAVVQGDDMHKWERGDEAWNTMTHLDPRANELHADAGSATLLRSGNGIMRRRYDHAVGKFTFPKKLDAKKIIVFEGLHSLFLNSMRKALDLKIFLDPEKQLQLHWKMLRDTKKRGYSKDKVFGEIKRREWDAKQYIHVQEKHSDISITLRHDGYLGESLGEENTPLRIRLGFKCSNDVGVDPLLSALAETGVVRSCHLFLEEHQTIELEGEISSTEIDRIADTLVPEIWETTAHEPKWRNGYLGLIQLFICYYIFEKMRMESHE